MWWWEREHRQAVCRVCSFQDQEDPQTPIPLAPYAQHAVEAGLDSAHLADLLPSVWADFIRNADMSDVRPLGTRSIEVVRSKYSLQP